MKKEYEKKIKEDPNCGMERPVMPVRKNQEKKDI